MSRIGQEAKGLGQDIGEHGMRVAAIVRGERPSEETVVVKDVGQRYCYRTQADILCYREPLPGQERRLVGYQAGSGAYRSPAMVHPKVIARAPVQAVPLAAPLAADEVTAQKPFLMPKKPVSLMSGM